MTQAKSKHTIIGFLYLNGRPPTEDPQDYQDFMGKTWAPEGLNLALQKRILPEGTILENSRNTVVVVKTDKGTHTLQDLNQVVKIKNKPKRYTDVRPVCPYCNQTFQITPITEWLNQQNLENLKGVM